MERFVFVAAVTVAIVLGLFHFLGGPSWSINIDGFEGGRNDPVLQVSAGRFEEQTFQSSDIEVKYAAARVVVTPEDRQDIVISIDNPGRAPMPEVGMDGGRLVVDGRLRGRVSDCSDDSVELRGYGIISRADLPLIQIRAPRTLSIEIGGASNSEIGPAQVLDASFSGCGNAQIGDVTESLSVDLAGSGEVRTGSAGELSADLAGSGELYVGAVANGAKVDLAGSGRVEIAALTGALSMDGAGSGDLAVQAGAVTDASIDLAGSGDVSISAPVERLDVSIAGSGDVDVAATVGDIQADIVGSGGVSAQSVTGSVHKEVWGSGDIHIGQ